jgi:acetolactate synthase I/II/III large subunit
LNLELSRVGARTDGNAGDLFDLSRPPLDFVALSQGMGVPAARAETAEDVVRELERALAEPGPHLIHAILPSRL